MTKQESKKPSPFTCSNKQFLEQIEFDFKKGQAEYWMKISLERPLTDNEFKRYKQLCKELGYQN